MASCVRTIHEQRRAHTLLRALCCSERASTASVGRPVYRCRLTSYFTFYFCSAKALHRAQGRKRSPPHRACPAFASHASRTLAALRLAHEHTQSKARSTRTLHACEPRQRRAHALTQQHALTRQKHSVVPRVTGNWLTVGRPAAEPSSAQSQR